MEYLKVNHQKRTILAPQAGKKNKKQKTCLTSSEGQHRREEQGFESGQSMLLCRWLTISLPAHLQISFCLRGEEFSQGHGPGNPALLQSLPQEDAGLDQIWAMEAFAEASRLRPVPEDRRPWGAGAGRTGHAWPGYSGLCGSSCPEKVRPGLRSDMWSWSKACSGEE